jgi:hypothetical protein
MVECASVSPLGSSYPSGMEPRLSVLCYQGVYPAARNLRPTQHDQVLTSERTGNGCFVCGHAGAHLLPRLPPNPPEWDIFLGSTALGGLSRKMNNLFTLTAMGIDNGSWKKFNSGLSAVTLDGGRTYHRLIPAEEGEHPLRWFVYDMPTLHKQGQELQLRDSWVAAALAGLRRVNPFVNKLENLARLQTIGDNLALHLDFPSSVSPLDVAAVVSLAPVGIPGPRKYFIRLKGEREHRYLPSISPLKEPLHYPMLLPFGTRGWSPDIRTPTGGKFSEARWYRTRFFMNAAQMCKLSRLTGRSSIRPVLHMLTFVPGEWLVDAWSSVEESRLRYIYTNRHTDDDDDDAADADDVEFDQHPPDQVRAESGEFEGDVDDVYKKDIRLPQTFVHSPAWIAGNVADCLALRRKYGPITFFTILTTDPKWPEIVSELAPGQNAQDRPDVVVRVFRRRLTAFIKYHQTLFGPNRYVIQVIEFQKRSLPHAHLAIALKHVPRAPEDLDRFMSAEVPEEPGPSRDAVLKHMIHSHRPGAEYSRCGWPKKDCQYGYPKPLLMESRFTDTGQCMLTR